MRSRPSLTFASAIRLAHTVRLRRKCQVRQWDNRSREWLAHQALLYNSPERVAERCRQALLCLQASPDYRGMQQASHQYNPKDLVPA